MNSSTESTKCSSSKWSNPFKGSRVASSESSSAAKTETNSKAFSKSPEQKTEEKKKHANKRSQQALVVNYFPTAVGESIILEARTWEADKVQPVLKFRQARTR
ncbi:hypothetical protein R1flu_011938 [Riccia fluitans]|uniref:Uncharacterized protein n=1 Tax=Riccia fluitans TaxID=41844 RepID=A0ABD1Z969_9MARC